MNMTLNVMEAPKCSPKTIDTLREREKLLLTCSVDAAGGSLPDVYWIRDGDPE